MKSTFYPAVRSVKQQGSAEFHSADILATRFPAKQKANTHIMHLYFAHYANKLTAAKGVCGRAKIFGSYYSQHGVCVYLSAFLSLNKKSLYTGLVTVNAHCTATVI